MLYLYTIMMFAWDLDKDTHAYLREYLDIFILPLGNIRHTNNYIFGHYLLSLICHGAYFSFVIIIIWT